MRTKAVAIAAGTVAALIGVFLIVGAVRAELNPRPPELRVTAGEQEVPVVLGTWCWKTRVKETCADRPAPLDALRSAHYSTVRLRWGEHLTLRLPITPTRITTHYWVGDKVFTEELSLVHKTISFPAPTVPGTYPMAFDFVWDQGHASYFIQVETK